MAQVQEHASQFFSHGCNVLIVCKGSKEGGKKWRARIGLELPVLADERSHLVESFDFPKSIWNAARTSACYVLAYKVKADILPAKDDPQADLYQMGGEVLMDATGNVLHVHKCKTPDDRPTCQDLIRLLDHTLRANSAQDKESNGKEVVVRKERSKSCVRFCSVM